MSYFYMNVLNRMEVTNQQTLLDLVNSRPAGTPLITVSNHMATYDWLQPAHPRTRRSRSPALPLFRSPALPLSRTSRPRPSPRPLPQPLSFLSLGGRNTRHAAVGRAGGAALRITDPSIFPATSCSAFHSPSPCSAFHSPTPCSAFHSPNPMLCLSLTHPMLRLPVRRIDDPLLWGGQRGLRIRDPKLCRWTLTASEICFTGLLDSYIFRIGKSIPITRNQGVFQPGMDEALLRLQQGDWLNIFPEARIIQQHGPLPRLKWGLASLLDRLCPSLPPPILLCVGHSGLERILPQSYRNNKRPLIPLWNQRVSVVVGEPFSFDLPSLRQQAKQAVRLDTSASAHSTSSSSSSSSSSSTDDGCSDSDTSSSSSSSSSSRSMSDSRHTSNAASDPATFSPDCQQERQTTAASPAYPLDPTWRPQQPTFGADALIHSPEVLTQRLQELMQRGLRCMCTDEGRGMAEADGGAMELEGHDRQAAAGVTCVCATCVDG
ncbi:unnamed protein product [Closterium sp. Naga37s-1]|nr:unnamed protein product [Closterium sp. Naga37s-1]